VALAIPSALLGWLDLGHWVHPGPIEAAGAHGWLPWVATGVAPTGLGLAYLLYSHPLGLPDKIAFACGPWYRLVYRKFYIDEVYLFITHRIVFRYLSAPCNWFDRHGVDGSMDLIAQALRRGGLVLRGAVTGRLQTYLLWAVGGLVAISGAGWLLSAVLGAVLAWGGAAALAAMLAWEWGLHLLHRSEPLKRVDRD